MKNKFFTAKFILLANIVPAQVKQSLTESLQVSERYGYGMIIHANGIEIYYEKFGQGKPFLILHGNSEDHTKYTNLASALSKQYSVYVLDTRCHGKSTKTDTITYLDMMEDVNTFISALKLEKPLLLGASDGAITGILLAIHYPDLLSGLICCGANTHPAQLKRWFFAVIKLGYMGTKDPKIKMMLTEPNIPKEELAMIQTPVLILAGARDILPTEATMEIAAAIPDSEVKILKGQTHVSYLIHYDRVLSVIQPFLNRISLS